MKAYLSNIVDEINKPLFAGVPRKKLIGIAEPIVVTDKGKARTMPTYIDNDGNAFYVGPDDDFDILLYHKCNGITVRSAAVSYGDENFIVNTARMSMIVFGRRDTLRMRSDEAAVYMQSVIPDKATTPVYMATNITVTDIVLATQQVFNGEFSGFDFFVKPEQFLFRLNYNIESTFSKACFNTCID